MDDRPAPTRVTVLGTDTVQLALGSSHALALKQGGEVFSWGHGSDSQLGLGDTDSRVSPTQMDLGSDNALIAAQSTGGMALKADGRLFNWGYVCCTTLAKKLPSLTCLARAQNAQNQLGDGCQQCCGRCNRLGIKKQTICVLVLFSAAF